MPTILTASGLSKAYGADIVFDDVSFKISDKDKIGIVGVNGAGKTTLLNILSSGEAQDGGNIAVDKNIRISYMRQHSPYNSDKSALDEVTGVFTHLIEIEAELENINRELEISYDDKIIKKQIRLNEKFVSEGGLTFRGRARSALLGLGFDDNEMNLPLSSLSGGQRTRVVLAKVLLSGSEMLLLDEPTNHLDISSAEWLEGFLISYDGAVVIVSHDRYFLDKICNKTFELENNKLKTYPGNYTYYKEKKEFDRLTLSRDYEKKSREIKRIEGIIEQQKRFNQERNYITIKSKQKQIDRIASELERPEDSPESVKFDFQSCGGCGNEVLKLKNLTKSFSGKNLFSDLNLLLKKGEKTFIVGRNGCGKTTLLKIIMNRLCPDKGTSELGAGVRAGYYEQTQSDIISDKTVFEEVSDSYPHMSNTDIRKALASFLFKGDDVFKKISELSGGERARIMLVKLMMSKTNFLLLDEPTNHLDLPSKEVLENALREYDGTILAVSHDRYFVNRIADKIIYMDKSEIKIYNGNYDYFQSELSAEKERGEGGGSEIRRINEKAASYFEKKERQSLIRRLRTKIERLEQDISDTENYVRSMESELEQPHVSSDYEKVKDISYKIEQKNSELKVLYEEWEQAYERLHNEEQQATAGD